MRQWVGAYIYTYVLGMYACMLLVAMLGEIVIHHYIYIYICIHPYVVNACMYACMYVYCICCIVGRSCFDLIACIRSTFGNGCILSRFFSFILTSNKFLNHCRSESNACMYVCTHICTKFTLLHTNVYTLMCI
jgi:hypothetical protein